MKKLFLMKPGSPIHMMVVSRFTNVFWMKWHLSLITLHFILLNESMEWSEIDWLLICSWFVWHTVMYLKCYTLTLYDVCICWMTFFGLSKYSMTFYDEEFTKVECSTFYQNRHRNRNRIYFKLKNQNHDIIVIAMCVIR